MFHLSPEQHHLFLIYSALGVSVSPKFINGDTVLWDVVKDERLVPANVTNNQY